MGFHRICSKSDRHIVACPLFQSSFSFCLLLMTKGRWKKLCRPPTHGVSQYRFTAARVQWPCSTVTIKPIWSLKWSGQVCRSLISPLENLLEFHRVRSYGYPWEHREMKVFSEEIFPKNFFYFFEVCREQPGLEDYYHTGLYQCNSG